MSEVYVQSCYGRTMSRRCVVGSPSFHRPSSLLKQINEITEACPCLQLARELAVRLGRPWIQFSNGSSSLASIASIPMRGPRQERKASASGIFTNKKDRVRAILAYIVAVAVVSLAPIDSIL